MSDYESLVDDLINRYPHLVLAKSGPWRERDGQLPDKPWICDFKNSSMSLQEVHPGSSGATMFLALKAGMEYIDRHADDPAVRNPYLTRRN
ncbi:hypothetical protein GWG65_23855 [Bradyrhizobium sp. CSA207]|uniref:hypothetical protein n=1 Tax=Bradyrhizobium sp. CSA207 TaxID=2698826 RepID=UPI0023B135B8|nr:hypothetical protein [Bradyrhizobium sp. CSA207]MDE5444428.1 hypothetical protein [Bradyrhizobium sp. CSA207]